VFEILRIYSSWVELMLLNEVFVDLTGCGKLNDPILKKAETMRNEIRPKIGLSRSVSNNLKHNINLLEIFYVALQ
jgi:hypothetical protein